jgi:hypothetical protein
VRLQTENVADAQHAVRTKPAAAMSVAATTTKCVWGGDVWRLMTMTMMMMMTMMMTDER